MKVIAAISVSRDQGIVNDLVNYTLSKIMSGFKAKIYELVDERAASA